MRKVYTLLILFLLSGYSLFSQASGQSLPVTAFVQGAKAFSSGEWTSSIFLLRKAVSYPENFNPDTWYMLITAEMYAGEYKNAYQDCETYMQNFPESPYDSYVLYHRGRSLFCMGEYEKSVLILSDFCHQYPDHEMYPSALYWIAEAFFEAYNYDDAEVLYSAIVNDYSDDAKADSAQYRLEIIKQAAREEKLIYLLKETGEEYLAAKEEYERQLRLSGVDSTSDARRRILDLQRTNADLERRVLELENENEELQEKLNDEIAKNGDIKSGTDFLLSDLKRKAEYTKKLLEEKQGEGKNE
ncbi:MAG: tetratricopeptide repeat protein [Treponema sp.]|nr:tetratricopeptide repeat protein [Treponema sp.]